MKSQKGFSLVELIIVIGLIGIMSTIAYYSWQSYRDNTNMKTAARDIMADLSAAKQRAVAEGVEYCMQFTDGSPLYTINAGSCDLPTATQNKDITTFGTGSALAVESTNFNLDRISFLPRGTLATNFGNLIVRNGRGSRATIRINITGRIDVQFAIQ